MVIVLVLVAVVTVVVMRNRGGSDGLDGIDSVDEDDDDLRGRGDKSGKHNFSLDIQSIPLIVPAMGPPKKLAL